MTRDTTKEVERKANRSHKENCLHNSSAKVVGDLISVLQLDTHKYK